MAFEATFKPSASLYMIRPWFDPSQTRSPSMTAIAAVFDGVVEGNVLQLVTIFTLNNQREVSEIRVFSRPWPVTAYFRGCMYELLKDSLEPEYWQGPDPEGPLPIR